MSRKSKSERIKICVKLTPTVTITVVGHGIGAFMLWWQKHSRMCSFTYRSALYRNEGACVISALGYGISILQAFLLRSQGCRKKR